MSNLSVTRTVVIRNSNGLHARPAERLAREASQFQCRIEILCRNERVAAKSIMDLLTLGATQGTELVIEACGEDAERAVEILSALIEGGFVEEEVEDEHGTTEPSSGK